MGEGAYGRGNMLGCCGDEGSTREGETVEIFLMQKDFGFLTIGLHVTFESYSKIQFSSMLPAVYTKHGLIRGRLQIFEAKET